MKKISILIPCYNEEESLPSFYETLCPIVNSLSNFNWEFLFINDGSKDQTLQIIKQLKIKDSRISYINLSRNVGKEAAMLAGFDYASGDAVIILDADLQDPPNLIPEMIKYWEEGYDDVYAMRRNRGNESWLRRKLSLSFYKLLQGTTNIDILPNVGDFRLLDRTCIIALQQLREKERYTKGLFCWIGFKKKGIIFDRGNRISGRSSWNISSLFNLAIEGITSFTTMPLRIASATGFLVSLCAIIYMVYKLVSTIIWGDPVQGFPTLITIILFLGGIQLLAIGVIGEYLGKIFNETKNRPVYIVEDYVR